MAFPILLSKGGNNVVMGGLNGDNKMDLIIHPAFHKAVIADSIFASFGKGSSPLVAVMESGREK